MERTSAAIAAAEAKVASVLSAQPAMASNAAPPGLGNAAENAPTPFPYLTSARKHADLSAEIAGAEKKIESADEEMESAEAKSASGGAKMESADTVIADIATMSADNFNSCANAVHGLSVRGAASGR